MADFFFYGVLCHPPLLEAVLGHPVAAQAAMLAGQSVHWATGESFPVLVERPDGAAHGLLVAGLSAADVARTDFYARGYSCFRRGVDVKRPGAAGGGLRAAQAYVAAPGTARPGADWRLSDWVACCAPVVVAAALDLMASYGSPVAERSLARHQMLLIRAASRLRAATEPEPSAVRRHAVPGDVQVEAIGEPYASFFAVEEHVLRHRRFDGSFSQRVERAAFVSGDAATVLPYDPVRDRVMLVEQFRPGPFARGDRQPWQLEPIAGRIDPFETPEAAARREALEETGLQLDDLMLIARYYPSPGAKTEFLYSFIGLVDLPDAAAGVGGLLAEGEDIRAHLVGFADLLALIESGEVANAPLILSALWLAARRDALRTAAGVPG